jgi:DNA-3-methyladenine glycosylase I
MEEEKHAGAGVLRCPWAEGHELLREYHDREWGLPLHDEGRHFEYLMLETMQAGLSWLTILKKREAFRSAFAGFAPERIARFGEEEIAACLQNPGIIRNRRKIEAAVKNARAFLDIRGEFGSFDRFLWSFTGGEPVIHTIESEDQMPAQDELSETVSAELKRRGFSFVGPVIVYAHLQAVGVINDHLTSCFRYREVQG